jgi:hypothetical protein
MPHRKDGTISSKRRAQARKHAERPYTCPECQAVCYGNGSYTHFRACILRRYPDLKTWPADQMRREYWKRVGA